MLLPAHRARRGPHKTPAVLTPAPRPDAMSCGESPMKIDREGLDPRRSRAVSTGSGCGLGCSTSSADTMTSKSSKSPRSFNPRSAPARSLLVTTPSFARRRSRPQDFLDVWIDANARVVMYVVKFPIGHHHCFDEIGIRRHRTKLLPERGAEPVPPHRVRRLLAEMGRGRVPIAAKDQLDRIDERAVEIEKEGIDAFWIQGSAQERSSAAHRARKRATIFSRAFATSLSVSVRSGA